MTDETEAAGSGRVLAVNVGTPRVIEWLGEVAPTSIWKTPVAGRVAVRGVNVAGDDQADRHAHGGRDKAIYSYAHEDTQWWARELGRLLDLGQFGENLTLTGVDVTHAIIGEQWAIGTVRLEVAQPRIPCWKLGARMGDQHFPPRFAAAGRPGAYLRILDEGEIGVGDALQIIHRPAHGVTVADIADIYHNHPERAEQMLQVPELAGGWRQWAGRRLGAQARKQAR